MSESKLPGLTKIRVDSAQVQRTMDLVDKTLSNPMKVFDIAKCVGAEKIINGEIKKCTDLSDDVSVSRDESSTNFENIVQYLEHAVEFNAKVNESLDDIETQLELYGYRKYNGTGSLVEMDTLEDNTPTVVTDASVVDTPSFLSINASSSDLNVGNGRHEIKRELSFSE